MDRQRLCTEVADRIRADVEQLGCMLVGVEFDHEDGSDVLRVLIDRKEGVCITDCERVSEVVGMRLDDHPNLQEAYLLDVTTPGVERPLSTKEHLAHAVGQYIAITTTDQADQRFIEGWLELFEADTLVIRVPQRKKPLYIPYEQVVEARLCVNFD